MLREVTLTSTFFKKGVTSTGFLLETNSDFFEYFKIEQDDFIDQFGKAIKSSVPVEKWDHLGGKLGIGFSIAKVTGGRPIVEAANMLTTKERNIYEDLQNGKVIFINKNGGYHFFTDETHTIIEEKFYVKDKSIHISFAEKPSLLNLENDPELEPFTIEYFKENNLEISSITHLRKFSEDELVSIFKDFKLKGGTGVFVYTTGMDYIQMKEYIDAVIEAEIDTLIIKINSEIGDGTRSVLDFAKENVKNFTEY